MKSLTKEPPNNLAKAKVVNKILFLADSMFKKEDLPNRTASVLLYFNLAEYYLGFLVRYIPLKLNQVKFNEFPLGGKLKMLKNEKFQYKDELLDIGWQFNEHRIDIVHKMVETIFDAKMEKSINETKRLFDELNKYIVLIAGEYDFT